MTAASSRRALKALAVTTAALGAVLVSGSGASADSAPSPVKIVVADKAECKPPSDQGKGNAKSRVVGKDGAVVCLHQPSERGQSAGVMPRGGVAAGERPVAARGDGGPTTVIVGATAAAVTLAAAGAVVIRRRTAHHDAR
ncbi:hypothetical protein ACIQCR_11740 [Streptomyces sp. NPDC093249]|uniref:hypothetical protein n=1 Tax=unclassified Streptomyces TaxID=2593676 RepID=UPI0038072B47